MCAITITDIARTIAINNVDTGGRKKSFLGFLSFFAYTSQTYVDMQSSDRFYKL